MNNTETYSVRENEDQGCRFRRIKGDGIRITLEVTGRCNLHCQHCFACSEKEELTTKQFVSIIQQLPGLNTKKIILTGGEPLLRMDVEKLIQAANFTGIGVDLNTNLSSFSQKRAKSLWNAGLREISTSIDGFEEYHDWFRRQAGDFERVKEGITRAVSMGFDTDVHGVCTPGNVNQVGEIIDICAQLGISSYTLLAVTSLGHGTAKLKDKRFSLCDVDKQKLSEILEKKREQYKGKLTIRTVDIFNHPNCTECPMGEEIIGITPTGKVMPCLLADYIPGERETINNLPLKDILKHIHERLLSEGKRLACSNATALN